MNRCHSCGRTIAESEAYKRIALGGEVYLFCCPMCMSAFEARPLQRRMIPRSFSDHRVSVFVEYLPALQVGGDYACIRSVGEDRLYLVIGDISGHGITSALLMSRISTEIERLVEAGQDLAATAEFLNNSINSMLGEDWCYLTLFGAAIDFPSQTLSYINCGHPGQLLWSQREQTVVRLDSQNLPLGLFSSQVFGTAIQKTVQMQSGDKLLLFTDGISELEREDRSELGEAGLIEIFHKFIKVPREETQRRVVEQIQALQKGHSNDDVLFIFADLRGT